MAKPFDVVVVSLAALLLAATSPAIAGVLVQCPGDSDGDAFRDPGEVWPARQQCRHLAVSDGYVVMADGRELYIFGFTDVTGVPPTDVLTAATLAANYPGPVVAVDEGDTLYLSLTSASYLVRPDLPVQSTFHWSGYPQAAPIFNGEAESAVAIKAGSSMTYFFRAEAPGTFTYRSVGHPVKGFQMGELGTIVVHAAQDRLPDGFPLGYTIHHLGDRYAYDDGDGSTRYDLEVPVQIGSFDASFHDLVEVAQPAPYLAMKDDVGLLNGRGYPDTINPSPPVPLNNGGRVSQPVSSRIVATAGQRVLLRIANLSSTRAFTLACLGIPMRVVGRDGSLLRGPDPDGAGPLVGRGLSVVADAVTLGSGETADAILDTSNVAPGTYFLYAANLDSLTNGTEGSLLGGMMTEVHIQ